MNNIVLIGRLTEKPKLRHTNNGTPVCNFTLAVDRNYTNKDGERDTDFIKIVTWRKRAETCAKYLDKGSLVGVQGSLQINKRQTDDRTYINPEIQASNVEFLSFKNNNPEETEDNKDTSSNDNSSNPNSSKDESLEGFDDEFEVPF